MVDLNDVIAQAETDAHEAQQAAELKVTEVDAVVGAMGSEKSRLFVTKAILVMFAVALLTYGLWAIFGDAEGLICADQAQKAANQCTGRWDETKSILSGIAFTALLPLVTLAVGYYYGKAPETDA